MVLKKVSLAVLIFASLCAAQSIIIRGIVKDLLGNGIGGATVKLETASISTTTGSDGSFTLAGNPAGIAGKNNMPAKPVHTICFRKGRLEVSLSAAAPITMVVYDFAGRQIFSNAEIYNAGDHIISSHLNTAGLNLYKISIGRNVYTYFASLLGHSPLADQTLHKYYGGVTLAKQADVSVAFRDVILVTKDGQINFRDSIGTSDTSGIVIEMLPNAGSVMDLDGNVYQSVRIGNQVWTVENLRVTKFNNGIPIPNVTDARQWSNLTTSAFCYYNNETVNKAKFGALYNWYAVKTGKLSPEGWHVSTIAEWDTLRNYLIANRYNWDSTVSENKIAKAMASRTDWSQSKETGSPGNDPGTNNASGFSALPGGYRNLDGDFITRNYHGNWWSLSKADTSVSFGRGIDYNNTDLRWSGDDRQDGFSVRLLRD